MTNSYHIEIEYHYDQFVHIFIMVKIVSPVVDTWMFEIAILWYEMVNYGTKWLLSNNRNYSAILAILQITSYAIGV
jgi:hypothetical protein